MLVSFTETTPTANAAANITTAAPALAYFEEFFEGIRYWGTDNEVAQVGVHWPDAFAPLQPVRLVRTDDGWPTTEVSWDLR